MHSCEATPARSLTTGRFACSQQLTLPAGSAPGGVPLSVSLLGQHDSDAVLLGAAAKLSELLAEAASKKPMKPKVDPEEAKRAKAAAEAERRQERAESYKAAGNRAFKEGRCAPTQPWPHAPSCPNVPESGCRSPWHVNNCHMI